MSVLPALLELCDEKIVPKPKKKAPRCCCGGKLDAQ